MSIIKFNPDELTVVTEIPDFFGGPNIPIYNFPVTGKEAVRALYEKKPLWQILFGMGVENQLFMPGVVPDNVARAMVHDVTFIPGKSNQVGGRDLFGIEWEYIPSAQGSMVRPGKPYIEDANDIKNKIKWPDIDSWDWEGSQKINEQYLSPHKSVTTMFFTGWFERLISFMDFEGAILALVDEDQQDAIKDFFNKLSDLYIRILDKYVTYFPQIYVFCIHDDWGSQKDAFFSPHICAEMIVPYMRRVTDFLHSKGKYCDFHSCGSIIKQVSNMIAAGFDSWNPQTMNDCEKIYDMYGDKIIIGTMPEIYDPHTASEEEQRAIARSYVEKYCRPEKPSALNTYAYLDYHGRNLVTPAFREEIYKQSRISYSE